ncbi:MAG: hypothetical protein JNK50_00795 [Bacteroidia bacterium]|nr:hypothetical protein [Bacteroidia bacterium]
MKKISTFLILIKSLAFFSQSGAKWSTSGNGIGIGEFIGTTTNFPLDFRTNNAQRMSLGVNGVLNLNSLIGNGNRVLLADAYGNISALSQGNSNQYLSGNGTWNNFPSGVTGWSINGNVMYNNNSGYVGIGTSNPNHLLDVNGDMHIANNLYVDGKILISDRIESGVIRTDSIMLDSTTVIIGDPTIGGDLTAQNKLNVMAMLNLPDN